MANSIVILEALCNNEIFTRKVIPFIKPEYFETPQAKEVFKVQAKYFADFNSCITPEALAIELGNAGLPEKLHEDARAVVEQFSDKQQNLDWLIKTSETWCRDRAIYNAITKAIDLTEKKKPDSIPLLLQEALAVTFDTSVGHDYLEDTDLRYDFYHRDEQKIPFGIAALDLVTNGGPRKKSLVCIMAATGAGKSALMTSLSAFWLTQGLNVLYISLEMAQELIAERIDANLMDIPIHQLSKLSKDRFETLSAKVKSKARGRLIVKDMPTSSVHTGHIRTLIQELQTKKKFKPDVICVDYINLLLSQRFKGGQHNSYTLVKSAAEELRGLAMELDVPIITATQLNRAGIGATDVDMTDTSESMGLVHSLDAFIALIATEELEAMNQVLVKVLKNRWGENGGKFMLGVDRPKMRFYDLDGEVEVEREEVVTTAMRNQRERPSKQLK